MPHKVSERKVYEYIKKVEIDGLPRVRAYAEAIDEGIYDVNPQAASNRLDYFQNHAPGYKEIKEAILAEQQEWSMRKSAHIQDKAVDLLANLLDKANQIATDPDADAKQLATAVSTLKAIMPAFTAVGNKQTMDTSTTDKKARAGKFIC